MPRLAGSRWRSGKLGRMYAAGEGVPHDDAKAYDYFLQIVNNYDEGHTASRREIGIVASAYVAVGVYSLNGLPQIQLKPDVQRAQDCPISRPDLRRSERAI